MLPPKEQSRCDNVQFASPPRMRSCMSIFSKRDNIFKECIVINVWSIMARMTGNPCNRPVTITNLPIGSESTLDMMKGTFFLM